MDGFMVDDLLKASRPLEPDDISVYLLLNFLSTAAAEFGSYRVEPRLKADYLIVVLLLN